MKLIRLTTTQSDGEFNCLFNEDISFKKNAKIALQNLAVETDPEVLTVNSSNDEISFSFLPGTTYTTYLTHGEYLRVDIDDFLIDMSVKMNAVMPLQSGKLVGMEWLCKRNKDDIVSVAYNWSNQLRIEKNNSRVTNNTANTADGIWNRSGGTTNSFDSYVFSTVPIAKGTGIWRTKIYRLDGGDMLFGVAKEDLTPVKDTLSIFDYAFGIRINGTQYKTIVDGVETATGIMPHIPGAGHLENDWVEISISEGKVRMVLYNFNAANPTIMAEEDYDGTTNLFPLINFLGTNTSRLYLISSTPSPFFSTNSVYQLESEIEDDGFPIEASPPTATNRFSTNNSLKFEAEDVAHYLGFKELFYGTFAAAKYTYLGEERADENEVPSSFMIEALNLSLSSYDSESRQRRSLLAIIPNTSALENRVIHEPSYPTFINIDNDYDVNLRNLKFRILDIDGAPINLQGKASMTLLVDDGES